MAPRLDPVTLEGRFVRMEPLALSHIEPLLQAARVSRTTYGLTRVPDTSESMRGYVEEALALQERGEALPFATFSLRAGAVVGTTRFGNIEYWRWPEGIPSRSPVPRGPDTAEIGWTWLAEAAQRTPVNSEAKLLMLRHAFTAWGVRKVILKTDRRNARSRAAIERLGARLDGVLRAHMPAYDGEVRDSAVYSILASEWPGMEERLSTRLRATSCT